MEHNLGGPQTKFEENKDPDLEENTGVAFPGQPMEGYIQKTYNEVEKMGLQISSYFDMIVVERRSDDGHFIF